MEKVGKIQNKLFVIKKNKNHENKIKIWKSKSYENLKIQIEFWYNLVFKQQNVTIRG